MDIKSKDNESFHTVPLRSTGVPSTAEPESEKTVKAKPEQRQTAVNEIECTA